MSTVQSQNHISIVDLIRALRRSPLYFIFWFILTMLMVAIIYFIVPRKYSSEGKFYVQVGRSSVGSTPTTSEGMVMLQDSRETEVKSVVGMLQSRELAERVTDLVGVEEILRPGSKIEEWIDSIPIDKFTDQLDKFSAPSGESNANPDGFTDDEIKRMKRRDKAIKRLTEIVNIENEKKTTVVTIDASAQTPRLAQSIVDNYLNEYQAMHVDINKTQDSDNFFEKQFNQQASTLETAERQLETLRTSMNALTIAGKRTTKQKEIDQLTLDRAETIVKLGEADQMAKQYSAELIRIPQFIRGLDTKKSSLAADRSRETLYALEIQVSEAASIYNESDPRLRKLRDQLRKAKSALAAIPKSFSEKEENVNVAHQEVQVLHSTALATTQGLKKRLTELDRLISENKEEIRRLNDAEVKANGLETNIAVHRTSLEKFAEKRAESETLSALDSKGVSNVKVAQPASLILKKVFPSGMVFGILGILFSTLIATVMTFFKNFELNLDRPIAGRRYATDVDRRDDRRRRSTAQANERPMVTARSAENRNQVSILWVISSFCILLLGYMAISILVQ